MEYADVRFEKLLRKRLIERKADLEGALCEGRAHTFDDYRYRCGAIASLREVLTEMDEVRKDMFGNDAVETE